MEYLIVGIEGLFKFKSTKGNTSPLRRHENLLAVVCFVFVRASGSGFIESGFNKLY